MKKIILLAVALSVVSCRGASVGNPAATLNWLDNWDTAIAKARQEKKDIIVAFSTEWCQFCKFMDEKIFTDPKVVEALDKFVLLKLDGDKETTSPLMEKFDANGFPTYVIVNPSGVKIGRFDAVDETSELIAQLEELDVRRPGSKELDKAGDLLNKNKLKEAKALYKKAYVLSKNADGEILEDALYGLLYSSKGDLDEGVKYAKELFGKFPNSPRLPQYYIRLADYYDSSAIKNALLQRGIDIIEGRLKDPLSLDARTLKITLWKQGWSMAEAYKQMGLLPEAVRAYERAGKACELVMKKNGGIKKNSNLLNNTVQYYTNAERYDLAEAFLKKAVKELPDYFPVYKNMVGVLKAQGKADEALPYAMKARELASGRQKPKMSFVIADVYVAGHHYDKAIEVLEATKVDLLGTKPDAKERKRMPIGQIDDRIKEIKSYMPFILSPSKDV